MNSLVKYFNEKQELITPDVTFKENCHFARET